MIKRNLGVAFLTTKITENVDEYFKTSKEYLDLTSSRDVLNIVDNYCNSLNGKCFYELTFTNTFGVIRFGVTRRLAHLNIFDVA